MQLSLLTGLVASAAALRPPCPEGVADDPEYKSVTSAGKIHDCAWVRASPAERCNGEREAACGAACGRCLGPCTNGEVDDKRWYSMERATQHCPWVAEDPDFRCSRNGQFVAFGHAYVQRANEACKATCGYCVPPGGASDDDDGDDDKGIPKVKEDTFYADEDDEVNQFPDDKMLYADLGDEDLPPCPSGVRDAEHRRPDLDGFSHSCSWVHFHLPESCEGDDGALARKLCAATCQECKPEPWAKKNETATKRSRAPPPLINVGLVALGTGVLCSLLFAGALLAFHRCRQPAIRYQSVALQRANQDSLSDDDEYGGRSPKAGAFEMVLPSKTPRAGGGAPPSKWKD